MRVAELLELIVGTHLHLEAEYLDVFLVFFEVYSFLKKRS